MKITKTRRVIMYYKIKKLKGRLKVSQISRKLGISRKTVYFYMRMSDDQFYEWNRQANKKKLKLYDYEDFVKGLLEGQSDFSAAQIQDRLLELEPGLVVGSKTVYNFVKHIRKKYHIPKPVINRRPYEPSEAVAYGEQAQVDFGSYSIVDDDGGKQKIHFMCMVLSASRHKFVYFQESAFTAATAIVAHEKSFAYFEGIPKSILYDQDSVFVVDENSGDFLLTEAFQKYVSQRKFIPDFCRKSDPETKGKIESVVKYTKYNFLRGRPYKGIDSLNREGVGWLNRTANAKVHGTTRRVPKEEWEKEKAHLWPYFPLNLPESLQCYELRKDNSVSYKGNLYTVPRGTFQEKSQQVWLKELTGSLWIYLPATETEKKELLTKHSIPEGKGNIVRNNDHKRDKSRKVKELTEQVAGLFSDTQAAGSYLKELHRIKNRYMRDQLVVMEKALENTPRVIADQALEFCRKYQVYSAGDFKAVVEHLRHQAQAQKASTDPDKPPAIQLLHDNEALLRALPHYSKIQTYQQIFQNDL